MPGPANTALRAPRRALVGALGGPVVLALLAGCDSAKASTHPTWVPQPSPSAIALPTPNLPGFGGRSGEGAPTGPGGPSTAPSPGPSSSAAIDPNVVATRLSAPTGIAVLPDGTALVGERTTGRLVLVQPVAGKPVPVLKTITGLDTADGGGLLDLALSPSYLENGLILALITTPADTRVVQFTRTGPVTPVLTGIARGPSDNTGRLLVRADGSILVGTGDAGRPTAATDPASRSGKVLRVDELGRAAAGNPAPASRVYTSGHRMVNGLCDDPISGVTFEVETGATDELNVLVPGSSYGWPGGGGTDPLALPATVAGVGDCAVARSNLYVTGLGGQALYQAQVTTDGRVGPFTPMLAKKYGRLLSVAAGADGSLWITTSNKDGRGRPVAADERVLHITPAGAVADSPV